MKSDYVIKCRGVVRGKAEGEALVARATLSFWGEVDPASGQIIASGHPLEGQCLRGRVLVIESTKGSSATPLVLGLARQAGNAPAALVNMQVDSLAVLGCVVNHIPMVADLERDPFDIIESGDYLHVDADNGMLTVIKKEPLPSDCIDVSNPSSLLIRRVHLAENDGSRDTTDEN